MNRRTMSLVVMLAAGVASAADFSEWQKKMPITFSGYTRAEALTNYPALVVLSTNLNGFSYADFLSTNADLRFTDSTQTNELKYEVDNWDTNGSSYVWVQVPLLTNNAGIYAFWGKSAQAAPTYTTNGAAWSNGYVGVWHLQENGSSRADATRNGNTGTAQGNTSFTAAGAVAGAAQFDGGGDYITVGNVAAISGVGQLTVSGWVYLNTLGTTADADDAGIFARGTASTDSTLLWYNVNVVGTSGEHVYTFNSGDGNASSNRVNGATGKAAAGKWQHVVGTMNGATRRLYVDGALDAFTNSAPATVVPTSADIARIGGWSLTTNFDFNGRLDEVRISTVERSSNWVWACYVNQASNGSFNTYGLVQTADPSLPQIANIGSQNPSSSSIDVVGRLITNGTSASTVTLYWSTTDGRTNASDWTTGGSERDLGVQAAGAIFTNTLTGLASNTTYYWNHKAVNASGTVWAATSGSPSFSLFAATGKTGTTTQVGDWSNPATWVSGYIPQGGDVAIVNHNIALTNSTPLLAAYTINAGKTNTFCTLDAVLNAMQVNVYGTLTHTNNTATSTVGGQWIPNGRVAVICSNLLVETNGSINADMRGYGGRPSGYGSGYGPGGGSGTSGGGGGGGYGGAGGGGVSSGGVPTSPAGPANGVASAPDQPGSGGGNCSGDPAGAGGGLIWIQATQGTVTVNGRISADGGYLTTPGGGTGRGAGGSGGGICIACKTFAGTNGLLSVVGGIPQGWWPGGGGGGRIAVVVDPATQAGAPAVSVQFRCAGGLGRDGGGNGASGTLYVNDPRIIPTVWSGRAASAVLLGFSSWAPSQLAITNAALSVGERVQLNVSSLLSLAGTTNSDALALTNGSSLICGGDLSISNTSLSLSPDVDSTPPTLTVNGNVSMVNTGRLYVYAAATNSAVPTGAWVNVAGTMSLTNGSVVYPYSDPVNGGSVIFTLGSLTIATNSGFNADGKGYRGTLLGVKANGLGPGGGKSGNGGGGGGYGGAGGASSGAAGGVAYGTSNNLPVYAGSGGGNGIDAASAGGSGGGLIWISVSNTATLDGYLRASSGAIVGPNGNGGGSGGGIYLKCSTLQGTTGRLTANGGNGGDWGGSCDGGGGGGGGRIQVWSVTNLTGGALTASVQQGFCIAGHRGNDGAPGTVYWGTVPENNFTLPAISNGSALNLSNTSADVVGTLVSNGIPAATVYLYWSTNNGMTNATAWTTGGSVSNLGGRADNATFTNTLTGLTPNTTYYWTYSASNSAGTAWAATNGSSFTTHGPPGVNNAGGATDISQYGATLNGNLTNGGVASVSILLGTEDGVWSMTNNLGTTNQGPFSYTVGGLSLATTYYYTSYATNAFGWAQAAPSVVFTTRQGLVYYWVGASNANWSAAGNWSATSGGAPGAGVPGALDDAIFDAGGVSNALIDAAFAGAVYSVSVNEGYRGTITQSNNLTVAQDFCLSTGTWQFVTGCAGTLTVGGDMVVSNATIYCQRASAGGEGTGRVFTVGGNLTIGPGGRFDAREFGFANTEGPGPGGYNRMGSHGGDGSRREATTYGSITRPVSLGGAGYDTYWGNRNGSGAIRLVVTGATVLAAGSLITVDGIDMAGNRPTSAGGSIFLTTATLTGNGTLSAKGGYDAVFDSAGGGRIAVWLSSGTDFGGVTFAASGGAGVNPGAAGTIYLQTSAQSEGQGRLIVDNNNKLPQQATTMLLPGTALNGFSQVAVMNSGNIGIRTNIDFSQANIVGSGVGNAFVSIRSPASGLTFPTNISGNYTLNIDAPVTIPGNLTVATNARLSHTFNTTTSLYALALTVASNLTLNGPVNVDGQGYTGGNGPGTTTIIENGAGHGGCGGGCTGTAAGGTYGSITNPVTLGSGGPAQAWVGSGGGAIKLAAGGLLTVNAGASISACAYTYAVNNFNGRGAGGSINITCASLAGAGTILADGGKSFDRCGGGGGRIAIYLTASDDFGPLTIQARGGARAGSYTNGGAGTVYLKKASASYGTLIIDTTNAGSTAATLISSNVTGAVAGDVVITNAAVLALASNQTLSAYGHWMNRRAGVNGLSADTNSTVILAGTNAGTVYGHTSFFNLTATNAGKVLTFEAGKTNTVLGALILDNLTLLSTVDGEWWYLTQPTNAPQNIRAVMVKDSNASGGQTLYATRGDSLGHNVNWWFPSKGSSFMFR